MERNGAKAGLTNLYIKDWSGLENIYKIRHNKRVKNLDGIFSFWEKMTVIFSKIIFKYGIKDIIRVYKSARKINPLYSNGTLGYFLIRGEKSFSALKTSALSFSGV